MTSGERGAKIRGGRHWADTYMTAPVAGCCDPAILARLGLFASDCAVLPDRDKQLRWAGQIDLEHVGARDGADRRTAADQRYERRLTPEEHIGQVFQLAQRGQWLLRGSDRATNRCIQRGSWISTMWDAASKNCGMMGTTGNRRGVRGSVRSLTLKSWRQTATRESYSGLHIPCHLRKSRNFKTPVDVSLSDANCDRDVERLRLIVVQDEQR